MSWDLEYLANKELRDYQISEFLFISLSVSPFHLSPRDTDSQPLTHSTHNTAL